MSQYPPNDSPQQSPQSMMYGTPPGAMYPYHLPGPDLLGPARRAGVLMIVVGVLVALLGACNGGTALVLSPEMIAEQQAVMRAEGLPEQKLDVNTLRTLAAVMGGLTLIVGIALIINGVYIRRGGSTAITVGMIASCGLALLMGLFVLISLLGAFVAPVIAAYACFFSIPLALFAWLAIWLIMAARNSRAVEAARGQYQAMMYHYQQQPPQAYGYGGAPYAPPAQQGYGYAAPPPPAPPTAPPTDAGGMNEPPPGT